MAETLQKGPDSWGLLWSWTPKALAQSVTALKMQQNSKYSKKYNNRKDWDHASLIYRCISKALGVDLLTILPLAHN